jgi:hypothetical protein
MPISQDHAVRIAQDFVQSKLSAGLVRLTARSVQHESVGDVYRWVIMFDRVAPPDVVLSPGEIIVLVDEANGTPTFEYVI